MEFIMEILFGFLLECLAAIFSNEIVRKWIRLPLQIIMCLIFVSLIVVLVVNGSNAITKGEIGKGILLLSGILLQFGIGYWYIAKRKVLKTSKVAVLNEVQTSL